MVHSVYELTGLAGQFWQMKSALSFKHVFFPKQNLGAL